MLSTYSYENCPLSSLDKGPPNGNGLFAVNSLKNVDSVYVVR